MSTQSEVTLELSRWKDIMERVHALTWLLAQARQEATVWRDLWRDLYSDGYIGPLDRFPWEAEADAGGTKQGTDAAVEPHQSGKGVSRKSFDQG